MPFYQCVKNLRMRWKSIEFHEAMTKPGTEVYSLKMTKEKRKGNMKLLFDLFKGETEVI